jgi:hypothetical protein
MDSFLVNKYTKWYHSIIERARTRTIDKGEWHHVLPVCMGGKDSEVVHLTLKEHFVCHMLLIYMVPKKSQEWYKLVKAIIMMKAHPDYPRYTSKSYEVVRKYFSESMSVSQTGELNSQYGTFWVTDGLTNKRIGCSQSIPLGFVLGRRMEKRLTKKPTKAQRLKLIMKWRRKDVEKLIVRKLRPLYERHRAGESLRDLSKDYEFSWVSLHKISRSWLPSLAPPQAMPVNSRPSTLS